MRKVVIFGATGMTGLCAVQAAINKEYIVRAFVRDPSKLPKELADHVDVVEGDVLNYEDVLNAIEGMDSVVVVLGTRNDLAATTLLSDGMRNIVLGMKHHKVSVVSVCLSAFLFYDAENVPPRFRDLNNDHQRQMDVTKESGLNYICILPPHIADQNKTGYTINQNELPGRIVSKYDLGEFLIDAVSNPEYYQKVFGIASK